MANKYQIDILWFSRICTRCAPENPWDALFLACNVSPMDTDIIREAISEGFRKVGVATLCDPRYFEKMNNTADNRRCWSIMDIGNITTHFGLKLGLLGLLAYRRTFAGIKMPSAATSSCEWETWHENTFRTWKLWRKPGIA